MHREVWRTVQVVPLGEQQAAPTNPAMGEQQAEVGTAAHSVERGAATSMGPGASDRLDATVARGNDASHGVGER